jgi:DNA invertase Pin-like site-specific DNA recombinase
MSAAAIYARYSSDLQREASIEDQNRICRERAAREGWSVYTCYSDRGISGASLIRPGIQKLLQDAQAGRFAIVVTESLDRLSRDQEDIAHIFKRITFAGGRIVTLSEGEINELHIGLKGTMGALYLKDLADKTRRGLRGRVEAGKSGGGNSYGYDVVRGIGPDGQKVTGERRINAQQAAVVRRGLATSVVCKRFGLEFQCYLVLSRRQHRFESGRGRQIFQLLRNRSPNELLQYTANIRQRCSWTRVDEATFADRSPKNSRLGRLNPANRRS